ncbi:MAG TPA: methylenetetrahydrofolate reductase [Yaniella sp.]
MSHPQNPVRVHDLLADFSLEITGKDAGSLQEAASAIPQGTRINVTFLGHEDLQTRVAAAKTVRDLGFVSVPHISARRIHSESDLKSFLSALAEVDAVDHVFAVGGDPADPVGPYASARQMLESGIFEAFEVQKVAIAGYPEGHPDIAPDVLARELKSKLDLIAERQWDTTIVTQFGFDVEPIASWLNELAALDIRVPVRIGVPGPAGVKQLLSYARRFGVASSAGIVKKYGFSLTNLLGSAGPDTFLKHLAEVAASTAYEGRVGVHFYTFGGVAKTAQWIQDFTGKR